jgi:agmatinase
MHPQQQTSRGGPLYPFVGIPSFLRAPIVDSLDARPSDIAILGVPIDEGSPFAPGSRFGPRAIREQSMRFTSASEGCVDPRTGQRMLDLDEVRITDLGDVSVLPTNVEATFARVTDAVAEVTRHGALPVVLGGDHSISYPIVRAIDGPLHVVQFDAHLDYAPIDGTLRYTNAHPFRHVAGFDKVERLVQVGIRSLRTAAGPYGDALRDENVIVVPDHLRRRGVDAVLEHIPAEARCYVSIDMDALDSPLVPGCVSAEPDGLSYQELRDSLRALAERADILGVDLVEVNPMVDPPAGPTAYLAANVLFVLLTAICAQPRWSDRRVAPAAGRP